MIKSYIKKGFFLFLFAILPVLLVLSLYFGREGRSYASKTGKRELTEINQMIDTSVLTGRITFQSDRDGDEEIYVMNPQGTDVIQLTDNNAFDGFPVWSPDGKKIAFESNRERKFQIFVMEGNGKNQIRVTEGPFDNRFPAWSPDGKKIAYESKRDQKFAIYVIDLESKKEKMLTNAFRRSTLPHWSPDGKNIAFTANRLGWGVYVMDRDGLNIRPLDTEGGSCRPAWSPDGRRIAYVSQKGDGKGDIWIMNRDGSGKLKLTTDSKNYDYDPSWSPDGKWIVYASTPDKERGNWEIRIIDVVNGESKQITQHPARDEFPDWR